MADWYSEAAFLLHLEHGYRPGSQPPPLTGVDPTQFRQLLETVRPDAVLYSAKGQAGYVPYPTSYGNGLELPIGWPDMDVLALCGETARELGLRFLLGYATLVDHYQADYRPGWMRVDSSFNPYPNRALCPNSGYIEELLLPQLDELLQRYQPDGFWLDSEGWTLAPCYCSACENEWQMLKERSAPMNRRDSLWPEWLEFHRDSYQRYLGRVVRYLHDREPELVIAANGAYASAHREDPPAGIHRLTAELSAAYSLRQAGFEARLLDARALPWDLLSWTHCSARSRPAGSQPSLPVYPKREQHLLQEGALVCAHGGRWTLATQTYPDDALPLELATRLELCAHQARRIAALNRGTRSAATVAVLHSAATHHVVGNGMQDGGPCLDRIRGVAQMLQELHVPFDIVNEGELLHRLDRYRIVILPEQAALPHHVDDYLADWVLHGGCVVASGKVSPRIVLDVPTFALEEVLGIQWTGRQDMQGQMLHRGASLPIQAPACHVALTAAEAVQPLLRTAHEHRREPMAAPAVSRNRLGDGSGWYVAFDLFAAYHRCQYPALREVLADILAEESTRLPLHTTAPPSVDLLLRVGDQGWVLHAVNLDPGKSLAQNSPYIEEVPPTVPFTVTLLLPACPQSVRLEPDQAEAEWSYSEGALTLMVPSFHLHCAVVIELPAPPPASDTHDAPEASEASEATEAEGNQVSETSQATDTEANQTTESSQIGET